jgi:hypothetical protein
MSEMNPIKSDEVGMGGWFGGQIGKIDCKVLGRAEPGGKNRTEEKERARWRQEGKDIAFEASFEQGRGYVLAIGGSRQLAFRCRSGDCAMGFNKSPRSEYERNESCKIR